MKVAIVGASGAVGQELLKILEERNFPFEELLLFGSERSAGYEYLYNEKFYKVQLLRHGDDFNGVDFAFVSAGARVSKDFADDITRFGAIMIDNSSAFRMEEGVPLVVPEVNAEDAEFCPRRIISNPNCTTIQLVISLRVLEKLSHIKRVNVATYQAASGAGAMAMAELENQMFQYVNGQPIIVDKFPYQLAFNVIPQIDLFEENGYTKEEMKMYNETRKIMHSDILVSATCVRVPTLRAHSQSVWVEFEDPVSIKAVREAFAQAEGITLIDDMANRQYPMPLLATGKDAVFVGRIRKDLSHPNGFTFWNVSDQIRKGAALNAVQIAEYLIKVL